MTSRPSSDRGPRRATRADYTPGVRPRAARQDGQRRMTPGYLDDLSDTKSTFFSDPGGSTVRQTLLTPSVGKRVRLIQVSVAQVGSDGVHYAELYFGTGTTIADNPTKAIGYARVPDNGEGSSRAWGRGAGPVAAKNQVLSIRWTVAPATSHKVIVEYTEER